MNPSYTIMQCSIVCDNTNTVVNTWVFGAEWRPQQRVAVSLSCARCARPHRALASPGMREDGRIIHVKLSLSGIGSVARETRNLLALEWLSFCKSQFMDPYCKPCVFRSN